MRGIAIPRIKTRLSFNVTTHLSLYETLQIKHTIQSCTHYQSISNMQSPHFLQNAMLIVCVETEYSKQNTLKINIKKTYNDKMW